MQTRQDLQFVASRFAAQARLVVNPPSLKVPDGETPTSALGEHTEAAVLVHAAEAALKAASLVDADPAPIVAALEAFANRVNAPDVLEALEIGGVTEALEVAGDWIVTTQTDIQIAAAVQEGYRSLRALLEGLYRDFVGAETETSRRIAARIQMGMDAASDAIEQARNNQTTTEG